MSIFLFLLLSRLIQWGAAMGGGIVTVMLLGYDIEPDFVHIALILSGTLGPYFLAHRPMRRWLRARCPECGGPAACRGMMPVRFECSECGHRHWSRVFEIPIFVNDRLWIPPWVEDDEDDQARRARRKRQRAGSAAAEVSHPPRRHP